MSNDTHILIKDARVSFPHLFKRPTIQGQEGKCGCVLMLEPERHAGTIQKVQKEMEELRKSALKNQKVPSDKRCLRDGDDKGRAEYEGYVVLSDNSRTRPYVIDFDGRTQIENEEDCHIYAGCYVNAKIRLWAQDNKYGKRLNAELVSIQFLRDGEPLDGRVSVEEAASGFDTVNDYEDDDDDFLAA